MRIGAMTMALLAALLALAGPARAQFVEGTDYVRLAAPLEGTAPGAVQVTYFFDYGCPHCAEFRPMMARWRAALPDDVAVRSVPLMMSPPTAHLAKLHYAIQALELAPRAEQALFDGIHVMHFVPTEAAFPAYLAGFGVTPEAAAAALADPAIDTQLTEARALAQAAGIRSWPALVVGRYRVDGTTAGSRERMLPILDFLIAKVRSER